MKTALDIQQCVAPISHAGVSPLSVSIKRGEIVCILGPDSDEKTRWLRTLAGLNEPASGDIFCGRINTRCQNRKQWELLRRKLAYVGAETSLLSAASGLANVMLPAKYHQIDDTKTLRDKAHILMTELGVQHQHEALPAYMRRDQCYRLALARALMLDPEVLILDNPFAHNDATGNHNLKQFLLARVQKYKTALLIMFHDIEFSLKHAQQILFVSDEQVYCFNKAEQFSGSPIQSIRQYLDEPGNH